MSLTRIAACLLLLAAAGAPALAPAQPAEAAGSPFDPDRSSSVTYQFLPPAGDAADDPVARPPAVAGRPFRPQKAHKPRVAAVAKPQATAVKQTAVAAKPGKVERDGANTGLKDDVGQGSHLARQGLQPGAYIGERYRKNVREYYARAYADGKACPPGVQKVAGKCAVPSGHAWSIGQPLPAGVAAAPVPQPLMAQLPPTPPGHRYVQVRGDIVLIASGSKMVVDAIDGLLRM